MTPARLTKAAAAVVAVLAVGYPASAWYLGKQIEAAHTELDAHIAALPYLKLVKHDYQRELFSATEVITLEIPAEFFTPPAPPAPPAEPAVPVTEATPESAETTAESATTAAGTETAAAPAAPSAPAAPVPPPAPLPPIQITVKTEIQHGPLPGFNAFGAGSAKTVIVFDDATQQKLATAFGGKQPLDIQTLYSFGGGGQSIVASPSFKFSFPGKTEGGKNTLSSDGLTLSVDFARGLERYSVKGEAPRFEMLDEVGAKIVFAGLKIESTQQRMFVDEPLLYSGNQRFALAEISAIPGQEGGAKVALKDLSYDVSIPAAGEHIDMIAKIGAGELKVSEQSYGPAHYDFTVKHVHARKLAALHRGAMALYSKPMPVNDAEQMGQLFEPLKKLALDLVMENPEFSLDRLSVHTADGDASISARIKLNDAKPEDFANPMMLMAKVDFGADLTLPAALIATLQGSGAANEEETLMRKQATEQSIASVVEQGYVTNESGILKTRIAFRSGQLLVNDKPFNPMAVMAPPAAAQQ